MRIRSSLTAEKGDDYDNHNDSLNLDTTDANHSESVNCDENNNTDDITNITSECSDDLGSINADSNGIQLRSRFIECEYETTHGIYNSVKLHELAIVADRYGISDRAAAALASATLVDFKIITSANDLKIIDRNKVRRSRKRARKSQIEHLEFDDIRGLYFDGRCDTTLKYENGKMTSVKEEHISFIQEPNSGFIGHKAVTSKKAHVITDAIEDELEEKNISTNKISIIGSDGEVTNTGVKGGVVRLLEERWQRPLQRATCMLHMCELQVKDLMKKLDGGTQSPGTYSGEIGNRLKDCEKLPLVEFEPIDFDCSVENVESISDTLSSDQKYLFDMCCAISSQNVSDELANRVIGPVNHARWTTTANRLLRIYVSDDNPSENLATMVKFIMTVYIHRPYFA